jgi:putative addiction module component (TIGR02574 family)
MSPRLRHILEEALTLTSPERAELAVELAASIDGGGDADAQSAWAAEIERRARRALAGESRGEDWESVRTRIEKNIRGG